MTSYRSHQDHQLHSTRSRHGTHAPWSHPRKSRAKLPVLAQECGRVYVDRMAGPAVECEFPSHQQRVFPAGERLWLSHDCSPFFCVETSAHAPAALPLSHVRCYNAVLATHFEDEHRRFHYSPSFDPCTEHTRSILLHRKWRTRCWCLPVGGQLRARDLLQQVQFLQRKSNRTQYEIFDAECQQSYDPTDGHVQ